MKRKPAFLFLCFSLLLSSAIGAQGGDKNQAIYLFNLIRYIDWKSEKIVVGVMGDSPVTSELEVIAKRNSKVEVRSLDDLMSIAECQMVFFPKASDLEFFQAQSVIADLPILLIVDRKQLVANGAEMGFYNEDDELKFVVNTKAIDETGIRVSHSILERARTID
jgi:hypothetical protein